jgi:hypothetical protein
MTIWAAPAMEAGISNHVWMLEEIVDLAFSYYYAPKCSGAYRPVKRKRHA